MTSLRNMRYTSEEAHAVILAECTLRLERCGVNGMHATTTADPKQGTITTRFDFTGRDEAGHAVPCTARVMARACREEQLRSIVEKAMRHHERLALLAGGRPPIEVHEDMDVGHLLVNAPLAARLLADHGAEGARRIVALAVTAIHLNAGNRRKRGGPLKTVPNRMSLTANRLDHRERLADDVHWRGHSLVLHSTDLSAAILQGLPGTPAYKVCAHPLLAHPGNVVRRAESHPTTRTPGGTTTILVDTPWIPADRMDEQPGETT